MPYGTVQHPGYLAFPEVGAEREEINNPRGNTAGIGY